jgi:hypothetical protein
MELEGGPRGKREVGGMDVGLVQREGDSRAEEGEAEEGEA